MGRAEAATVALNALIACLLLDWGRALSCERWVSSVSSWRTAFWMGHLQRAWSVEGYLRSGSNNALYNTRVILHILYLHGIDKKKLGESIVT